MPRLLILIYLLIASTGQLSAQIVAFGASKRGIDASKVMVLVFSENANTSAHVRREVAHACDHETTVIPLRIRDVTPKQGLKYYLDELHASIPGVPLHLA